MADRISKLQRWLDLIAYLVGRRLPVPVDELMERVPAYAEKWETGDETARATARRTFERDKDELRKAGIPIQTVRYHVSFGTEEVEGYRIDRRDFYLPYLKLVQGATGEPTRPGPAGVAGLEVAHEDAGLALEALRRVTAVPGFPLAREARSAFRKLAFDLDPTAFAGAPVLFVERPGAAELSDRLRALSDALLARKRVTFRYHGIYRGQATDREVAPYGLLFQHGHWYLIGHDSARDAERIFRVGRMEDVVVNTRAPNTPDYAVPDDFRLDDYAGRQAWELGDEREEPIRAEVLFRFPAAVWAERNRHGTLIEARPDGSTVRAFDVHQTAPFLRWILGLEHDAEILEPPVLRDELRALARDVAAVYRRGASGAEPSDATGDGSDRERRDADGDASGGESRGGRAGETPDA